MRNGIMVALDGTRFAEAALPLAMQLARRDGLPLRLVTVWQPMLPLYDTAGTLAKWERELHGERHVYMTHVARKVEEASGAPVSVEYLKGRPGEMLPPYPGANDIDLVVMATHGHGPIPGSVAEHMVRRGTAPVLMVRPAEADPEVPMAPAPPFGHILVPLDGSELAETALQQGVLAGGGPGPELTLLRVLDFPVPFIMTESGIAVTLEPEFVQAEMEAAHRYLDGVAARISWSGLVTTRVIKASSPWSGISEFAASQKFDLIAMSTHGRGGAARLLLGSVAHKVVRASSVPVLLFHPERAPSPWKDVERLAGQVVGMP